MEIALRCLFGLCGLWCFVKNGEYNYPYACALRGTTRVKPVLRVRAADAASVVVRWWGFRARDI